MQLSRQARERMAEFEARTAEAYGGTPRSEYAATPSVAQMINDRIVEDGNPFLARVNVLPVTEIAGEKIMPLLTGPVASRTDTSTSGERVPKKLLDTLAQTYSLVKIDSDVAIRYQTIDSWAKFPDLADRYNRMVRRAIGNDRLRVGWYGTSAAATTNSDTNPNLQDVAIGWLQKIRSYNSGSQFVHGTVGAPVALGSVAFPNLDVLVYDALGRVDPVFQGDPDMVVLVSRDLMQAAKGAYYESHGNTPTEKGRLRDGLIVDTYGGLPALVPPFFPSGHLLVTPLSNLSIYWQETSWRRQIVDNPKKDQYEDYQTRNEGYVVEDERACSLVDGITIV